MTTAGLEKINYVELQDSGVEIHLEDKFLVHKNVMYTINYTDDKKVDIYAPITTSMDEVVSGPDKFLIFVQGGRWQLGDKELYYFLGKWFSKNGICCAIPNFSQYPANSISKAVEDVENCINYIKENFKIPEQKISLMGHSSGAHLCSMILASNKYKLKSYILISGIFKIDTIIRIGCSMYKKEDWNKYNVINNISEAKNKFCDSNVMIAAGEKDYYFSLKHSKLLYNKLMEKNIKASLIIVGGADHYGCLASLPYNDAYFEYTKSKNSNADIKTYRKMILDAC